MRIPNEIVQTIQQAADITEVVSDYLTLRRRGSNLIACCPFHEEKTPSFNVNPVRGIFKCFGCGKAGDSVRFVMEIEGLSFPEALRHLAKKYGIEIPEVEQTPEELLAQNERESILIALDFAKNYYQQQLTGTDEGRSIGLSYFQERGFNKQTLQTFELGYSPEGWDTFAQAAISKKYKPETLEKAGLITRKEAENRQYDRFRGRVMFPIHNVSGKVIGFGARLLKTDKNQAKYLNSPETEVYHKSRVLYGLFQAKQSIRQEEVAYLVEGYTDVLSLHQAGIKNVVASSGTALTPEQIRLLGRFTQNIVVLYDGDAAGLKAAMRGLDLILAEGFNVRLCSFPDGEDPDSYVRKVGSEGFLAYLRKHTHDFITFKAEVLMREAADDPIRRAEVIHEMVGSIVRIPDAIKRQVFIQQTARIMQVDEQVLMSEANKNLLHKKKQPDTPATPLPDLPAGVVPPPAEEAPAAMPQPERSVLTLQEEEFCRLLVLYGNGVIEQEVREGRPHDITLTEYMVSQTYDLDFQDETCKAMLEIFRMATEQHSYPDTAWFLVQPNEGIRQLCIGFVTERYAISENWANMHGIFVRHERERLHEVAHASILRLKKAFNDNRLEQARRQLDTAAGPEEQDALLMQIQQMKRIDQLLAKELGIVVTGR